METIENYKPENHVGDTMDHKCISLRTFILGEIKIYERDRRYEVIFYPNSWAHARGLKSTKTEYYDRNDAFTCSDWIKQNSIKEFNANK